MDIYRSLLSVSFCLIVTACSSPYSPPEVKPSSSVFNGIHPISTNNTETSLIMIHGMCHHDKTWVIEARDRLAGNFNMKKHDMKILYEDKNSNVVTYKTKISDSNYSIDIYGIVYGPATLPIKREYLCKDVSKKSEICPDITYSRKRAWLNGMLKNELMNNCLADAVIYLGETGNLIRKGVRASLLKIYEEREKNPKPIFLLSESLGSKVLRDSILCENDIKRVESKRLLELVDSNVAIYLGANQIPILNTGNQDVCPPSAQFKTLLKRTNKKITGGFFDILNYIDELHKDKKLKIKDLKGPVAVISFTDPNDLLSYEVDKREYGGNNVINVVVSNKNTWIGVIENPITAHLGYRENDDVIKLIKCGRNNKQVEKCMSM